MSMSVSCSGCGVHYAGKRGPAGLGAGVAVGGRAYLQMLAEVPRFPRAARRLLASAPPAGAAAGVAGAAGAGLPEEARGGISLGDFLREGGFSRYFTSHF